MLAATSGRWRPRFIARRHSPARNIIPLPHSVKTGRSNDDPLNVTSLGDDLPTSRTNASISSRSDLSPTWDAPRFSSR